MPSSRLRHLFHGLLVIAGSCSLAGCASIGGNMANSSGMGYYEKGNYAAAAEEFQSALKSSPNNPDYMANFSRSRMKMGDSQSAERYYRQALTIDPSHQPSYHGLAELMVDQGRNQEAQAMLTTWAGTQPYIAESHVELAWLQREMGNPQAAALSLERALEVNPNHATALAHMGQYYEETGNTDEAVAYYQDSLQADWNQPEVHSRMAAASQKVGADSPMAATAMARGVHPYSIARQQTAFGPPSQGAQMAQMQMMQSQMAMASNPLYGQATPGMTPNQMAMNPGMNQPPTSAFYPPGSVTGWHQSPSPSPMMPTQTASFGTTAPMMSQPADSMSWPTETTMPVGTPFEIPSTPASSTAVAPTPDPAFSSAPKPSPITTVSFAQPSTSATTSESISSNSNSETPFVDAF